MPFSKPQDEIEVNLELEPLFEEKNSKISSAEKIDTSSSSNKRWQPSQTGLLMAVGSCFMFSLSSLLVKILRNIPSTELALFRFTCVFLPAFPLAIAKGDSFFPKDYRLILILRGIFGTAALLLQFYAFQHLPLGDASVIVFSAPVFVAIFARIFLKEKCSMFQAVVILLTIGGVTLITRPPWLFGNLSHTYTSSEWKGVIAAFAGTIVAANVYVMLRALRHLHYSIILVDFAVIALIILPPLMLFFSQACLPQCGFQRWMILGIGFFSFGGQFLKTRALQLEEAGPVSVARTTDVIFAFLWQLIFFGDVPDSLTVLGTLIVTTCVIFQGMRRWILSMPENSSTRKRLNFLAW